MRAYWSEFDRVEERAVAWMARHSMTLLRVSMGIVFFWFGVLKFFPGLSPAEDLAGRTTTLLTFGLVPTSVALPVLAAWECAIGVGFFTGWCKRCTLVLLFAQMAGTVLPLVFFRAETFAHFPYAATLEGQYIIKNLVLVSAGLVIGATIRGGALVAEPVAAVQARPERQPAMAFTIAAPARVARRTNGYAELAVVDVTHLPADVRSAIERSYVGN